MRLDTLRIEVRKGQTDPLVESMIAKSAYPKTMSTQQILDFVYFLHSHRTDDLGDTNLHERIIRFATYKLQNVPLSKVNPEQWKRHPELIEQYLEKQSKYPPVVLIPKRGKYSIIDGTHRINCEIQKGHSEVLAYVGIP